MSTYREGGPACDREKKVGGSIGKGVDAFGKTSGKIED